MAKKPSPHRHTFSRQNITVYASLFIFVLALVRLRFQYEPSISISRTSTRTFTGPPKIAFLFLTRRDLPLDFLWGSFFQNGDSEKFSVYVHSEPGFVFDEVTTRSTFFYGRQLNNSIKVSWGQSSMIHAERLLLDAGLEDPANQRFVLLSDSCVPLNNFSYIYSYLMASPRSFVDSFVDGKYGRYNPKMLPTIPMRNWRKGSQRRPIIDATMGPEDIVKIKMEHNCIPDEHYVQTLLSMGGLDGEVERRTLTYTLWNQSVTMWHPATFKYEHASPEKIKEIKEIDHVIYKTESRKEWCRTNSTFTACFLFARKFSREAGLRLLTYELVGPFDASSSAL